MTVLSKPVIAVVGPTGTGKTLLGTAIALRLRTEVISVDSLQCYMDGQIITAAPTAAERNKVKHHMVDYLPPDAEPGYEYVQRALRVADELHEKGKIPVLVGGSTSLMIPLLFASRKHNPLNATDDAEPGTLRWNTLVIHLDSRNELCLGKKLEARVEDMVARGMMRELKSLYSLQKDVMRKNGVDTIGVDEVGTQGVWKCIGYEEMYPFLLATDNTLSNPSPGTLPHGDGNVSKLVEKMMEEGELGERLFKEGIDLMKKNMRRYAQLQTKWAESVLFPALLMEGMPVHRFVIPYCFCEDETEGELEFNNRWVDRVEGPAVRLCEAWEVLADLD